MEILHAGQSPRGRAGAQLQGLWLPSTLHSGLWRREWVQPARWLPSTPRGPGQSSWFLWLCLRWHLALPVYKPSVVGHQEGERSPLRCRVHPHGTYFLFILLLSFYH